MAHGYFSHFGATKVEVYSAGIETHGVNPRAIAIMKDDGVDISSHTSNNVEEYLEIDFDYIITVCDHAHENCPYIPAESAARIHHDFYDPSKLESEDDDEIYKAFARTRDQIKNFVKEFLGKL